jgi:N-methylhydantoinase B
MTLAYTVEGHHNPPRGVRGGAAGAIPDAWKLDAAGGRAELPKAAAVPLEPGERVVSVSGGGGGYGNPQERDPRLVLEDVREGWVSRESAERDYGVVLREDGGDGLELDEQATERLRGGTASSAS